MVKIKKSLKIKELTLEINLWFFKLRVTLTVT